jgi:hypothetical protein
LYNEAAAELTLAVSAAAAKLSLPEGFAVSYSGGLFRSGDCILKPLGEKLTELGCRMAAPRFSPELGAVLLAMRQVTPDRDFEKFMFSE